MGIHFPSWYTAQYTFSVLLGLPLSSVASTLFCFLNTRRTEEKIVPRWLRKKPNSKSQTFYPQSLTCKRKWKSYPNLPEFIVLYFMKLILVITSSLHSHEKCFEVRRKTQNSTVSCKCSFHSCQNSICFLSEFVVYITGVYTSD